jgi:subfamily B ATP-binding cassette protein MsbA
MFAISLLGYMIFASSQPMMAGILKYFVDELSEPSSVTRHAHALTGDLDLIYGVPLLLVLVVTWQGIGSFLGNYYLARVSLGLIHDLGAPSSTACCACRTAISTSTTPGI